MVAWTWEWWLAIGTMGLLMLVGLLLMVVILLQRGRGGGLAGAFGGAGGQSAFGTRAGDVFTKITAIMAILWVFLAGVSRFALEPAANQYASQFETEAELEQQNAPELTAPPGKTVPPENEEEKPPAPAKTPEKTPAEPETDTTPPAENNDSENGGAETDNTEKEKTTDSNNE